jgi:2,3-bisphosphoglycerate-independent phosphoglycerate mutase
MKYLILICDGAADWPIEELENKTIFEATDTPALDFLTQRGEMGLLRTIPKAMNPGSECANMTILGYDPRTDLTGRGPLEALSAGVPLDDSDIAFRCNLITIQDGNIKDYSAGHISTEESTKIIEELQNNLSTKGLDLFPGVQYRHILRLDGKQFTEEIKTTPPHDVLGEDYKTHLPTPKKNKHNNAHIQKTVDCLIELIEKSRVLLLGHEINKQRAQQGKNMATNLWPWSGGKKPDIIPFKKKYGLEGSVISAVDLIFGLGIAAGLEPIHVEGATGLPDTNYQGKVDAALRELKRKDFVYLHVEAIDEMGHTGDPQKKKAALRDFDSKIVKPFLKAEELFENQLKICVLPDHPTPCEIRTHSPEPVPFVIYDPRMEKKKALKRKFSESSAKKGELGLIETGEKFMRIFLK